LGPVADVYDVRLPDGGDLHFYKRMQQSPEERPDPLETCHVVFGDRITLVGLDLRRDEGSLRWRAVWEVERDLYEDYAVYIHFVDEQGRLFPRDHRFLVEGKGTEGRR